MSTTPPDDGLAAALTAVVAASLNIEMDAGRADDGSEWLTVSWPYAEVVMQRDALDGPWQAFHPACNKVIGTAATAPEALRAALAHA